MKVAFERTLGESEVAWDYISVDFWQREILGGSFTIIFSGKFFQLRVNSKGRIVSKALMKGIAAREGMRLTFRKEKDGLFSLKVS